MIRRLVVLGAFACALASPALAHPGHGAPGLESSWLHYVTEPGHVFVLAVVALGGAAGGALLARRRAPER
jgi:hydrogenase/urease accessory protein HupE